MYSQVISDIFIFKKILKHFHSLHIFLKIHLLIKIIFILYKILKYIHLLHNIFRIDCIYYMIFKNIHLLHKFIEIYSNAACLSLGSNQKTFSKPRKNVSCRFA